jgi:intracellular multiplication protein IcmT
MANTFSETSHWRDSARSPRFFLVDARAAFPIFLLFMHFRTWTVILAVVSIIFFGVLEHYGFTVPVFLRSIKTFIAGKVKSAQPWWRYK